MTNEIEELEEALKHDPLGGIERDNAFIYKKYAKAHLEYLKHDKPLIDKLLEEENK